MRPISGLTAPETTKPKEKALAAADRVYALVQGNIVLEAPTSESNLPQRLEHAYFGHESHAAVIG